MAEEHIRLYSCSRCLTTHFRRVGWFNALHRCRMIGWREPVRRHDAADMLPRGCGALRISFRIMHLGLIRCHLVWGWFRQAWMFLASVKPPSPIAQTYIYIYFKSQGCCHMHTLSSSTSVRYSSCSFKLGCRSLGLFGCLMVWGILPYPSTDRCL